MGHVHHLGGHQLWWASNARSPRGERAGTGAPRGSVGEVTGLQPPATAPRLGRAPSLTASRAAATVVVVRGEEGPCPAAWCP